MIMGKYYGVAMSEYDKNQLEHFGISGMKWGIRRYQNADGTYTEAGKKRYAKYSQRAENAYKSANEMKYWRERTEQEGKRRGEAWRSYGQQEAEMAKKAQKWQAKANKYAVDSDKKDMKKMLDEAGVTEKYSKKNLDRADGEEFRAILFSKNKSEEDLAKIGEEAFNKSLDNNYKGKTGEVQNDVMIFRKPDGSGMGMEYKKFDDKIDKKIRSEYGSDKELKNANSEMKKVFKQLGIDVTKAFGNGGSKENSFNKKSESEQLYIMLRLGESLGYIQIPDDMF